VLPDGFDVAQNRSRVNIFRGWFFPGELFGFNGLPGGFCFGIAVAGNHCNEGDQEETSHPFLPHDSQICFHDELFLMVKNV
jgi:hypothetical protein